MSSDSEQPSELQAPGMQLGQLRKARELSIADVAERIKYSPRQIEALEADDYARLPGTTFVRGMIRSYARFLEADSAPMLRQFEQRHEPEKISLALRSERIPFPDGSSRVTRLYLALAGVALVAAAAVFLEWRIGLSTVVPFAPAPAPVVAQQVLATAQPPQPATTVVVPPAEPAGPVAIMATTAAGAIAGDRKRITLEFRKDSWVEIKDGVGNVLLSKLNPGGTSTEVEGKPPFSVIIGNAANVRVTYDDAAVDLKPYVRVEVARLTLE